MSDDTNDAAVYMNMLSFNDDTASLWARKEIPRLRAELAAMEKQRDEARREVCQKTAAHRGYHTEAEEIAFERGWDCFKEGGGA